jgi:hypothetical protein
MERLRLVESASSFVEASSSSFFFGFCLFVREQLTTVAAAEPRKKPPIAYNRAERVMAVVRRAE